MPPKGHAILSASSSDRWLHCPPSARLCETYQDKGSDYAAEGTDAHELCEYKLKRALGMDASDPTENLTWYSEEMEDCANGYAAYILEMVEAAKESCADPKVLIEQRVDFSRWVEQGFGTADCIIIADGTLRICDYKHGLGVLVDATDNPQMKCYALGALELFDDIYDIDNVSMTIYQPRRQNISTCEISKDELYKWADEVLKPTADLAFAGDGNFLCGEWCGFCKAKHECRARAEANLTLARYDFKLPPLLEDSEIEYILSRADELVAWASDIKDEVLSPTAQLAAKGEGEYKAGNHCQFCKVKATCRKRAEYNLELARYDFEMPSTLEDDEIEAILSKVDALVSWAGDIKEYALQQAVSGKEWKDWKIVEGRSNRKYVNETTVADTVERLEDCRRTLQQKICK